MVQQDPQHRDLDLHQRFSWLRCVLSIISYLLMLSDIPRAGFGLRDLSLYRRIEPDQIIFFGPYAYSVTKQLLKTATRGTNTDAGPPPSSPYWPYKYDTTSVAMRAVAQHLAIPEWRSVCMTYGKTCDEREGIPHSVRFGMIDSLIQAVKTHDDTQLPNGQTGRLTLRTRYAWSDRLHDFAFSWFFYRPNLRTIQAIHYDVAVLTTKRPVALCSPATRRRRPLTCGDSWTNFDHHRLDFVLLEGIDDLTRPSLTSDGYKNLDVVALARIRKCSPSANTSADSSHCETILVDDFRYEVAPQVTNIQDWFWIIAILRGVGQLYAWMRLAFLVVGCYMARADEPRMQQRSLIARAVVTLRTLFSLPSQVVVYGSLFPVSCYFLAHLIDAAVVYELIAAKFSTLMGVMSLEFGEILQVCAVSMRSLWLLVVACHLIHRVATHCAWSPIHGVPGISEFSLGFIASLTVFAQLRHTSFRDTRILYVEELVPSTTRYYWNSMHSSTRPGLLYKLLIGTPIDYKCLVMSIFVYISVTLLVRAMHWLAPQRFPYRSVLLGQTIVPYSAGAIWPTSTLVVGWNTTFLAKSSPVKNAKARGVQPLQQIACQPVTKAPFTAGLHQRVYRSHETKTLIFLMNVAAMTDPLTWLQLRVFRGQPIGVYADKDPSSHKQRWTRSRISRNSRLLPLALATASSDIPIDWSELELRLVVHTSELDWCDLLQCG